MEKSLSDLHYFLSLKTSCKLWYSNLGSEQQRGKTLGETSIREGVQSALRLQGWAHLILNCSVVTSLCQQPRVLTIAQAFASSHITLKATFQKDPGLHKSQWLCKHAVNKWKSWKSRYTALCDEFWARFVPWQYFRQSCNCLNSPHLETANLFI